MAKKFVYLPLALILGAAWLMIGNCCRKGKQLPRKPGLRVLCICILLAAVLILVSGICFGNLNYNGVKLLENEKAEFRISEFAGKRGLIYEACLRCFLGFSWEKRIFGCEPDSLTEVIEPYLYKDGERIFRADDILNDAHCQLLHYLLTCGLLGFAAYTGFYFCTVYAVWKRRKKGAFANGILLSLLLYFPSFLVNVAQPVMLMLYFGSAGLGLSCIRESRTEQGS